MALELGQAREQSGPDARGRVGASLEVFTCGAIIRRNSPLPRRCRSGYYMVESLSSHARKPQKHMV
jgi:hypothetical protein